jgi:hypothetical protein
MSRWDTIATDIPTLPLSPSDEGSEQVRLPVIPFLALAPRPILVTASSQTVHTIQPGDSFSTGCLLGG